MKKSDSGWANTFFLTWAETSPTVTEIGGAVVPVCVFVCLWVLVSKCVFVCWFHGSIHVCGSLGSFCETPAAFGAAKARIEEPQRTPNGQFGWFMALIRGHPKERRKNEF